MKKINLCLSAVICAVMMTACGNGSDNNEQAMTSEPTTIQVQQTESATQANEEKPSTNATASSRNLYESENGILKKANQSAEEIVIGDEITEISAFAFKDCTKLKKVTFSNSVVTVGEYAFSNCSSLDTIVINADSSLSKIGANAFSNCTSLKILTLPQGVTALADNTFNGCTSLVSINLPSTFTSFGNYVFKGCSTLKKMDIPASVTTFGSSVFDGCTALKSINCTKGSVADNADFYPSTTVIVAK